MRAIKPRTGLNEQQFATVTRRHYLNARTKRECGFLAVAILDTEQREQRRSTRDLLAAVLKVVQVTRSTANPRGHISG